MQDRHVSVPPGACLMARASAVSSPQRSTRESERLSSAPMRTGPGCGDAPWPPSCVPAVQQRPGDGVHDGDEQAHHAEAGPGLEGVGGVVDAGELGPGLGRAELGDRVPPGVRQRLDDPGQDEQDGYHGGDGGGRVPEQGPRGDAKHRQGGQVQPSSHHRPGYPGIAERRVGGMAADEGLAHEERREAGDLAHDEGHHGEDQRLGCQYPASLRDGDQGGGDQPGGVLGADEEHPEHRDGHLGDGYPRLADAGGVPAQLGGDAEPGVGVGGDRADDGPQGDAEHDGHGQRPESRPDRTELDPLRAQHVAEGGCTQGRPVVRAGAGDHGAGHRVPPAARYSTLSRVSSMNASSSEARTVMSSNRVMPWAAASFPTSALSIPVISMTSGPVPASGPATGAVAAGALLPARTVAPASRQRVASSAAWGLRTCTECWELDCTNSSMLVSAISRPLPITSRWSAVRAISLIRWLETSTVRPSAACARMRVRTQWMPSGSRPFTGSSKISTARTPGSAAAMPSPWPMPSEKPFARRLATSSRPTMRSTSSTRLRGMPLLWARQSRWSRARRPPCSALASRGAPPPRTGPAGW